jgi:thiosulfate/3-mercaptopyruvate sulfurtransferase
MLAKDKWRPKMNPLRIVITGIVAWLFLATSAMASSITPLVDSTWLAAQSGSETLRIIDLRNKIDGGSYETWLEGHIPGSVHSDYLKDGWRVGRDDVVGLLPESDQFQALARKLGVNQDTHVVLVPAGVNATDFGSAARAYWTFKVFGHETVSILDGGYAAWTATFPDAIEAGAQPAPAAGNFVANFRPAGYASIEEVKALAAGDGTGGATLLDGRTKEQFDGFAKHPKAREVGHIPGAVLLSQANAYDAASNRLKSADALAEIYSDLDSGRIVSYCNTGHWAATNWFVLSEVLGRDNVQLYDGSMVEWSADEANPLATNLSNMDRFKSFVGGLFKSS